MSFDKGNNVTVLALRRKVGESVLLSYPGGHIELTVAGIDGVTGQATLAVIAPPSVKVTRKELDGRESAGERNR